jgi:hypothetical protein
LNGSSSLSSRENCVSFFPKSPQSAPPDWKISSHNSIYHLWPWFESSSIKAILCVGNNYPIVLYRVVPESYIKSFGRDRPRGIRQKKPKAISGPLHNRTFRSASRLIRILTLLYFANHQLKCLANILVEACTSLSPGTFELFGKRASSFLFDLTLFGS